MNQFRCKQVKRTVVLGFKTLIIGFFTVAVEKAGSKKEQNGALLPAPQEACFNRTKLCFLSSSYSITSFSAGRIRRFGGSFVVGVISRFRL
jgi:hypothetical protein